MASGNDIVTRSLRVIGVIDPEETPSATELTNGIETLNGFIDSLKIESLMVYALQEETLTLTGAASYTVGVGGNLNTNRPVKIEEAVQRVSAIDYPVEVITHDQWENIGYKSSTGSIAEYIYYKPSYPLGVIYPYPIPPSGTLLLSTWVQIDEITNGATALSLAPGYRDFLVYGLSIRQATEYDRPVKPEIISLYSSLKNDIKKLNHRMPIMKVGISSGQRSNIISGT